MICIYNQTCFIGLASIIRTKIYLNKHMQHSCFKVMFHMFQLNAILYFTCDYECKMMLMRIICNAKCMRNTGVLQYPRHYTWPCSPRPGGPARGPAFWPGPSTARPGGHRARAGPAWGTRPCLGRHPGTWHGTSMARSKRRPVKLITMWIFDTTHCNPYIYIISSSLQTLTSSHSHSPRRCCSSLPLPITPNPNFLPLPLSQMVLLFPSPPHHSKP
jgi:hypothetical protein